MFFIPVSDLNKFKMIRPKLVAEFLIFLLVATAILQIGVFLTHKGRATSTTSARQPRYPEVSLSPVALSQHAHLVQDSDKIERTNLGRDVKADRQLPTATEIPDAKRLLQNISRPYYAIVRDKNFKIDRKYFSVRPTKMSDIPGTFTLTSNVCSPNPKSPTILFVMPSVASINHARERLEIRQTWASKLYGPKWTQTSKARLAFFFGSIDKSTAALEALKQESEQYGDIVVGSFKDSYHNLSLKMAVVITWVARNCPDIAAAVKVDMDTYVNIDLLFSLMDQLPTATHPKYVYGHRHVARNPAVVRTGGWAVPQSLYPFEKFPRYIYGHAYVLSGPAVKVMADSFPYFPIVPNEDAFATGIMAVTLNVTRFHHDSFAFILGKRTLCEMTRRVHVTDAMKPENRLRLWKTFQTNQCIEEKV